MHKLQQKTYKRVRENCALDLMKIWENEEVGKRKNVKTMKKLYEETDHFQNIFGSTLERILSSDFQDQLSQATQVIRQRNSHSRPTERSSLTSLKNLLKNLWKQFDFKFGNPIHW